MKKALQFNDASASDDPRCCQSPEVQEMDPGGDRTLSGRGLFLEGEQNSVLKAHCGEQMKQSLDFDCYSSETGLKDSGETRLDISGPVGPGPPRSPESRPYHGKILQLFSHPHKGARVERLRPATTWSTISGLRVMGSFKKLRSSILQGIQNRAANQEMEQRTEGNQDTRHSTAANQDTSHSTAANQEAEYSAAVTQHKSEEGQGVVNGLSSVEDTWEDEGDGEEGLNRNSRFSRSLRMAYEDGRIALRQVEAAANRTSAPPIQAPTAPSPCPPAPIQTTANAMAPRRLSTSADNLQFYRGPSKCRPPGPQHGARKATVAHGIKRTSSTSSSHSPLRIRTQVRKLVSSMNDLSVRQAPSPAPAPFTDRLALSRLHDDYSRRLPCNHDGERQRRCLAARNKAANKENDLPFIDCDSAPGSDPSPPDPCPSDPCPSNPCPSGLSPVSSPGCAVRDILRGSKPFEARQIVPSLHLHPPQGVLGLQTEDTSPDPTRGTQDMLVDGSSEQGVAPRIEMPSSDSHTSGDDSPSSLNSMIVEDAPSPTASTLVLDTSTLDAQVCTADLPCRRVGGRRPRPLSDYGQSVCRKMSIPQEDAEYPNEARSSLSPAHNGNDRRGHCSSVENCNGNCELHWSTSQENRPKKQRPISVIGAVDFYSLPSSEQKEHLAHSRPPVPSHQVPPYRGVSVRVRPCTLSQSTPVGLDCLGQPRFHRNISVDGRPGGTEMLDDNGNEEDCSFDELLYLQPGAENSALNEWISSGQVVYAEALWDHVTMEEQELGFKAGDVIRVLDASNKDWWWGAASGQQAWFPSSFVRVRVNQEDGARVSTGTDSTEDVQAKEPAPGSPLLQSSEHRDQMRANVVNEIMSTERIYIKHLRDICEGYLRQCRKHTGMFTQLQINTIFSNIEDIYRFHRKFLKNLEKNYNKEQPHQSQIGSCFLLQSEFSIYSEYCNNHPHACAELHRLLKLGRYRHFFEACRLLQQMIDISVAGFLLTPVQKICKYPLQLGELLKYTPPEHRDHSSVSDAYEAMKKVACLINERKRRLESLDTIAHWQETILRWEGEGVLSRSSDLIHSGDLSRVFPEGKTQQRVFFLFDHQMVFCKKDVLRRDLLFYCGRLDTDCLKVQDVPDGRDAQLGLSLKNAFRLQDEVTREEYVFCTKKATDKCRWLQAFAEERRRVQEDQELGMEISESQRKRAILRARKSKNGKLRNLGYAGCSAPLPQQLLHPLHQRHVTVPTCVPQQPVFTLAEPKRKPAHLWDTLFRK